MQIRFGKWRRIQFTDRSHPAMGIVSVILGIVALIMLVALCVLSGRAKGNSGLSAGALGMVSMIMSIMGFIMAIRCYRQEDIYMVTPTLGSVINGILIVVFLLLFFIGAM